MKFYILAVILTVVGLQDCFKIKLSKSKSSEQLLFEIQKYTNNTKVPFNWANKYSLQSGDTKKKDENLFNFVKDKFISENLNYVNYTRINNKLYTAQTKNGSFVEIKIFDYLDNYFDVNSKEMCCIKVSDDCKKCEEKSVIPVEIAISASHINFGIQKLLHVGIILKLKSEKTNLKILKGKPGPKRKLKSFIGIFDGVNYDHTLQAYVSNCINEKKQDNLLELFKKIQDGLYAINNLLMLKGIYHNDLTINNILIEPSDPTKALTCAVTDDFQLKLVNFKNAVAGLKSRSNEKKQLLISKKQLKFNKDKTKMSVPELFLGKKKEFPLESILVFDHGYIGAQLCKPNEDGLKELDSVIADDLQAYNPKKQITTSAFEKFRNYLDVDNICSKDQSMVTFLQKCLYYVPDKRIEFSTFLKTLTNGKN